MPKQPPPPIHIRIDLQEQRSGIPELLAALPQVEIEIVQLQVGDYDLGGDPCRIVERKTATDFLISLQQGRLGTQLGALVESGFAPILLLEGDPLHVRRSNMRPEAIRGMLTYICGTLRMPILPSGGPEDSAHLLFSLARQAQVGVREPGPAVGRRGATLAEQQVQVLLALPGVGLATARALCARFGSLQEILTAEPARLATVPGITAARAEALYQLLHEALPTQGQQVPAD
jgi:Fanconi anemia group M protein